jgi:hypothetical protein
MQYIIKFFKKHPELEPFFPFPHAVIAEKIMLKNYDLLNAKKASIDLSCQDSEEFLNIVESSLTKEFERKNEIEDKAKSSLFVITLSLTFILSSLTFFYDKCSWIIPKTIVLTILSLGVIFLLLSGITSIKTLSIGGYNDLYIHGRLSGNYENLKIVYRSKKEDINVLYECIRLNEILTNIKANYMHVTLVGIKNGIIFIALFFVLAVINYSLI